MCTFMQSVNALLSVIEVVSSTAYEQAHDKTYNLLRVFADRVCLLQHLNRDQRRPLSYSVDVQADLSLC